ncbi:MAG: antibiotic ABC transporter ATP-binding protein [Gemmatimonas sp.]|nr:antibiotic ABC transporter ATP-binding protein [Gemmatimonas sp.]
MPDAAHDEERLRTVFDGRLARRLAGYVRPHLALALGALALLLVAGLLQLVGPLLTRRVIDVALPARDYAEVGRLTALFVGALLAQFATDYGQMVLTSLLGQRAMHDLRRELFAHLQRLSVAFFDATPVGRLVTRVTSDVESLNELFTAGVIAAVGDLAALLAIGVVMFAIDWRLTVAAFTVVPGIYLVSHVFQRRVRAAYRDIRARVARLNAFLQERLTGIRVVQLFGREPDEGRSFAALNARHLDAQLASVRVYALYFPAIEILTTIALAMLIVAAVSRVEAGLVTVGTVAAFLQLSRRFFQPLQDLSDKFNILQQAMASAERIFALLDTAPTVPDTGRTRLAQRGGAGVTVAFEGVWFRYPERGAASQEAGGGAARGVAAAASGGEVDADARWVLRDVSFRVRPGETLALIGHTGAGKTTVVSLLLRFYDPQRGRITIDGIDIRDLPVAELRSLVGYVQQDIFLFADDVATNIRLSAPLSHAAVEAAARRVGADRIIARLPGGYGHRLAERGASVSVGERQLLSFARAVAADPALLVLDEATSAVDSRIEADIQRALRELMAGRTTIAIAHRLSTIVSSTEILVMHHGEVRERGTHEGLLAAGGLYSRLYRLEGAAPGDSKRVATPVGDG